MTTEQIISRRAFPITVVLFLISLAVIFFLIRSNGENIEAHDRDREVLIKGAEQQKLKDDSIIASERHFRDSAGKAGRELKSLYLSETVKRQAGLKELKALRTALGIKPDTVTLEIEAHNTAQRTADSLEIVRLEKKIFSDSSSFERQISAETDKYLQQVVISDQHLEEVQELKTDLKKEKKRKTGWKIAAIALAGWVVYQEVKD